MRITSNNKMIDFNIIGYQYPYCKGSSQEYNYDANWLICEIKYSEDDFINVNETYRDACLLTYEVEELTDGLTKILNNEEDAYISNFIEPYLKIAIAKAEEKIMFTMQFVYSGNWKKRTVATIIDTEIAGQILNKLLEIQKNYPER